MRAAVEDWLWPVSWALAFAIGAYLVVMEPDAVDCPWDDER